MWPSAWGLWSFPAFLLIGTYLDQRTSLKPDVLLRLNITVNLSRDPFLLQTTSLPSNVAFNPTIANGFLGHAIYSDTIYLNGLYNGEKGDSHRARIPGTLPYADINKTVFHCLECQTDINPGYVPLYTLDLRNGTYSQMFNIIDEISGRLLCTILQRFYAHRFLSRVLVTEITIEFTSPGSVTIPLKSSSGERSEDIYFQHATDASDETSNLTIACGHTITPEQPEMDTLHVCCVSSKFPTELIIDSSSGNVREFTYLSSISNALSESHNFINIADRLMENKTLLTSHEDEWRKTWANGVVILQSDNKALDASVVSGIYYLLSAFPSDSFQSYPYQFFGASPGGLTNGKKDQFYMGHVFWDQDFWMLPGLLPLFPKTVQHGLNYRIARLGMAVAKAEELGFDGAFYPWESAYTGLDVCPGIKYILYEQHISGDIIHLLKQYIYTTGDWNLLLQKVKAFPENGTSLYYTAWNMTYQIAKFWYSRAKWSAEKNFYEINEVMGPDEYHAPINNSAFTNVVASQNLKFAVEAASELKIPFPEREQFLHVINNMFIPYDSAMNFHPEFEGFNPDQDIVKQADTIMLGFPLMYNMSVASRKNDLEIYGNVTTRHGPAMTWSMFSINYSDLEELSWADHYFMKQLNNIQPPFQIWAEEPGGKGAVNFLTGIGGYLQSILYGYLRLRVYRNHFTVDPRLPPVLHGRVNKMIFKGLKVQGVTIDIIVESGTYSVTLSGFDAPGRKLVLITNVVHTLNKTGVSVSFPMLTHCYMVISTN